LLIGLLSDTHIALPSEALPPQVKGAFSGVDLILHAGDIWIPFWRGRSTPCAARMTSQAFFELAED